MKELIFIVDDEPDILELINLHLVEAGYRTQTFAFAKPFFQTLNTNVPDLILLDIMLPDGDGLEICKKLKNQRQFRQIPVILITSKATETDKILGLEFGSDDYITKPFSPREMVARVKAVLRRTNRDFHTESNINTIGGILLIDKDKVEVSLSGKNINLTTSEYKILELLSTKTGWVFSRDQILDYIWGDGRYVTDRTVDVHIRNLREKLGPICGSWIKNIRGMGYKIDSGQ